MALAIVDVDVVVVVVVVVGKRKREQVVGEIFTGSEVGRRRQKWASEGGSCHIQTPRDKLLKTGELT